MGCKIGSFNQCVVYGSNTWGTQFSNCSIINGYTNLLSIPSGISNSGESISFVGCTFINNGSGTYTFAASISLAFSGCDLLLVDCSVDQAQISVTAGLLKFTNLHMETDDDISGLTFITATAWIMGSGLSLISGNASSTITNAVVLNGATCHITGFDFTAAGSATNAFLLEGAAKFTLLGNIFNQATNLYATSGLSAGAKFFIDEGSTGIALTLAGQIGTDLALEINNLANSGQSWALDSLNTGNFAIFPRTTSTATLQLECPVSISKTINSYNGITTAGNGVGAEVFQVLSSGLTANYNSGSAKTLFTPSAAGQWRISFSQAITQAATSSSTMPSLTLAWTDAAGISRTKTLVATSTANSTSTESDGVAVIYTNGSTAVTITSASYASSGATAMKYDLSVTAEQL